MLPQANTTEIDRRIEKDILSGKYKDYYLLYNRRSTDDANNQKNSLHFQKAENARFAAERRIPLAPLTVEGFCTDGSISEKHSGFKESSTFTMLKDGMVQYKIDRPKFFQMITYLNKGLFRGMICLCMDRISRNKADDVLITKLMKQGVDIRFAFATYDNTSAGELHKDVDSMFSAHHSRVAREKVMISIRHSRELGRVTNRAPLGYLNEGNMDHKPFDPVRAPIVKRLFELYATGEWGLHALTKYANDQGLTTTPMRRRRTEKELLTDDDDGDISLLPQVSRPICMRNLHRILSNTFYVGLTQGNDKTLIKSISHEPLVSQELFDNVQHMLTSKATHTYYGEKLNLPYRGVVHCTCGRAYIPYVKKGITYLYCRCEKSCDNKEKHLNTTQFETIMGEVIKNLFFTDEEIELIQHTISTSVVSVDNKRQKDLDVLAQRREKIRQDMAYLSENRLVLLRTGAYTPEMMTKQERDLRMELSDLLSREAASDVAMVETIKDVVLLSELVEKLYFSWQKADSFKKSEIIKKLFTELSLSNNTLQFKVKKAFECLETRFLTMGDPTVLVTELSTRSPYFSNAISLLQGILV